MKTKLTSSAFVLLVCLVVVSVVAAQVDGPPGSGWSTGIQVQNVGDDTAQVVLTGYDYSGSAVYTDDTTGANTAAGESVNYVTFPAGQSSFQGAGIVSSDQPIVAIVNVNNGAAGNYAAGQYQGTSGTIADTTVLFPLVKNNFGSKCTLFYIQNAGSAAGMVYASFSNGSAWNSGANVDPGDMVIIDPAAATPAVPSDAPYALTVTSTQSLAGTVLEYFCTTDPAETLQATRGFAPGDGATALLAPIYKQRFGNRTNGLQVQNVSGAAVDIYVSYEHSPLSGGSGTFRQWQQSVPNGASVTFFSNTVIGASGGGATGQSGTPLADGSLTAATITATGQIVAINNESYNIPLPVGVVRNTQTTYSAVPASEGGTEVGIPLVKEVFGNKTTGIQIQNAGTGQANVEVVYNMNAGAAACQGTFTLQNIVIDEGASETLFRPGVAPPAGATWLAGNAVQSGCFGGATINVVSGGPVVAVVQEADLNANAALRQDNKNYEGFRIQ